MEETKQIDANYEKFQKLKGEKKLFISGQVTQNNKDSTFYDDLPEDKKFGKYN